MSEKTYTGNEGIREQNDNLLWLGFIVRRNIRQQVLTIGVSNTKIPSSPLSKRKFLLIMNNSTSGQILYIGNSSVTTTDGFPVYPRQTVNIYIEDDIDLYGIASAADANIRILEGA